MNATISRQKAIPGFLPATYAVFCGKYLLQTFTDRQRANRFAAAYNNPECIRSMSTDEIEELRQAAFARYYHFANRFTPIDEYKAGMTFPELEDASEKLNAICDEILKGN